MAVRSPIQQDPLVYTRMYEVDYKEEHPDFIRNLLKIVLDVEVTESFFFFGNLKKTVLPPMLGNTTYAGSELEKQKRIKYEELTDTLLQLWIRTEYAHVTTSAQKEAAQTMGNILSM